MKNVIVLADSDVKSSSDFSKLNSIVKNGGSVSFVFLYKSCDEKKKGSNMLMKVENVLKTQALSKAKNIALGLGLSAISDVQALCPCKLKFYLQKHDINSVLDFQQFPLLSKDDLIELGVEYL